MIEKDLKNPCKGCSFWNNYLGICDLTYICKNKKCPIDLWHFEKINNVEFLIFKV